MTNQINAREIILNMLLEVMEEGKFSHTVLNQTLKKYQNLEKQDRAFITRVFTGTIKRYLTLDYIINQFSSVHVTKMKPLIRNLLRFSVYQLNFMDQIPESAVCNEAVKLAKKRGFTKLSGFVNGVLRNIARNERSISYPDRDKNPAGYLEITYSIPRWLVDMLLKQYSPDEVERMLEASLKEKETSIRCNLKKIKPIELKDRLTKKGIKVEEHKLLDYAFTIKEYDYLDKLEEFQEGLFTVQDVSSMLVCEVAGLAEDDFVVDVCAAPGGKTLHAAQTAKRVLARDLTENKVNLIKENVLRLGFDNIEAEVWDASLPDDSLIGKADVVIADLPCSGLGVFGKKPDIKYRLTKEQLDELCILQKKILTVVKDYVKPGGVLIYSTCTVNQEENYKIREWFLNRFDFQAESLNPYLPKDLVNEQSKEGYLQLLQGIHPTDGFFISKMRKRK